MWLVRRGATAKGQIWRLPTNQTVVTEQLRVPRNDEEDHSDEHLVEMHQSKKAVLAHVARTLRTAGVAHCACGRLAVLKYGAPLVAHDEQIV